MLTSIAVTPINHILREESWACKRLQSHIGKTVNIQIPPLFNFNLAIQADGEIIKADNNTPTDVTLTITPALLPRLLINDETAWQCIEVAGDNALATELIEIGRNLRLNAEEDFSKVIGDIPARRISQAGEHMIHWHAESIHNLSQALVEYWMEEQPILAKPILIDEFISEVKRLRNDVERLEARIERLTQRAQ